MKISTVEMLCCPFDKQDLKLHIITQIEDKITEGYFVCTDCQRIYPIIKGVPIMNPDEYREFSLEQPLLEKWGLKSTPQFRLPHDTKQGDNNLSFDSN